MNNAETNITDGHGRSVDGLGRGHENKSNVIDLYAHSSLVVEIRCLFVSNHREYTRAYICISGALCYVLLLAVIVLNPAGRHSINVAPVLFTSHNVGSLALILCTSLLEESPADPELFRYIYELSM